MDGSLLLVDGNNLLFRAFYGWAAAAPTAAVRAEQTAVGFLALLLRPVREFQPTHLVVVFDAGGRTFRHDVNAAYKANRLERTGEDDPKWHIPAVRAHLQRLGVANCIEAGVEADDVIASAAIEASALGIRTVIYSSDRDFLQLVAGDIAVRPPARGHPLYTPEEVWRRFQVHPHQFVDYKALQGDVSDNLPGVPGIGPKTAVALLQQHETVELLYERLWLLPEKLAALLKRYEGRVRENQALVRLRCDLPLSFSLHDCRQTQAWERWNPFDIVRGHDKLDRE